MRQKSRKKLRKQNADQEKMAFKREFDIDGYAKGCASKKSYASLWDASYAISCLKEVQPKLKLSFYHCTYCGQFHLTEDAD